MRSRTPVSGVLFALRHSLRKALRSRSNGVEDGSVGLGRLTAYVLRIFTPDR